MCSLFNLCLSKLTIPDDWKIALVKPLYKGKGPKDDFDSYRPISILSPLSKVFESCISERIRCFFELNSLFVEEQFGFRKLRLCEQALTSIVDDWRFDLDKRRIVTAMFIDLRKAFDTVDHSLLLEKLKLYNFSSNSVKLLDNYLKSRFFLSKLIRSHRI